MGFGGYVSTPAYLAARRLGLPIVVHEQNARPGLANRLGARFTPYVAVTFPGTPLRGRPCARHAAAPADHARSTGSALRDEALAAFGLEPGPHDAARLRRLPRRAAAQRDLRPVARRPGRRRRAGAARHRPRQDGRGSRRPAGARRARVRRRRVPGPDGPRLRRRRHGRLPGRRRHRVRGDDGRAAGGLRAAARSATASSGSTPSRSCEAGGGLLVDDARLHARSGSASALLPLLADPGELASMAKAAAEFADHRRRRAARRPRRARGRRGGAARGRPGAVVKPRPRPRGAAGRRARPGALHRHRRRRDGRARAGPAGPRRAGERQRRQGVRDHGRAAARSGATVHIGHDAAHVATPTRSSSPPPPGRQPRARRGTRAAACWCCTARRRSPP